MSTPNPQEPSDAIKAALLAGNKIEAIKLYREWTHVGLAEAKDAVEKMQAQFRHSASPELTVPAFSADSPDHTDAIKEALFAGKKIAAIKLYREQTKASLAEAKEAVEKIEAQLRLSSPEIFSAPPASKGCLLAIPIVVVLAATLWKLLA